MLFLKLHRPGDKIIINDDIEVTFIGREEGRPTIGIEAPVVNGIPKYNVRRGSLDKEEIR